MIDSNQFLVRLKKESAIYSRMLLTTNLEVCFILFSVLK